MFRFTWREDTGSFYTQDIVARDMRAAKARWRRYWGLRMRDCSAFKCIAL